MRHLCTSEAPPQSLVDRAKRELRSHYERGEHATAWEYLERFARLCENSDAAVSLIYEEFCLLEEAGVRPDSEEFCRRYPMWRHSLELQLRCHRELDGSRRDIRLSPPLLAPGDEWQGFRIDSVLGHGGTSTVYLAYERSMGDRPVALKVSQDRGPEPAIIGSLDHPRVMPAFSVYRDFGRGLRALCMPYRSGKPLDALARRSWPFRSSHGASAFWTALAAERCAAKALSLDSPGWLGFPSSGTYEDGVAWIALVVAHAVSYIHSRGVIHCDIKPSNIYVAVRDGPLLFDFGFARSRAARDPFSGGTLAYMAPEQLRTCLDPERWRDVGPAADTYALGLTMVELLLGARVDSHTSKPAARRTAQEWLSRRLRPRWLTVATAGRISGALEEIVGRCLAASPKERYASAGDLAHDLARFIGSSNASTSDRSTSMAASSELIASSQTILDPVPAVLTAPRAPRPSLGLQAAL